MSTTAIRLHTMKLANAMKWMRDNWGGDATDMLDFEQKVAAPFQQSWDELTQEEKKNMFGWVQEKLNSTRIKVRGRAPQGFSIASPVASRTPISIKEKEDNNNLDGWM